MKRISVVMAKGGVGKTTIASALAVRATKDFKRVAIVDLNGDQGDLSQWWLLRGKPKNPQLHSGATDIVRDLDAIEAEGWDVCIIDAPPNYQKLLATAIFVADVVIVPIKASIFDASAIQPTLALAKRMSKPVAMFMSDLDAKFKTLNAEVIAELKKDGLLTDVKISHLQAYAAALNQGKSGAELDDKAAKEINALYDTAMMFADMAPDRKRRHVRR